MGSDAWHWPDARRETLLIHLTPQPNTAVTARASKEAQERGINGAVLGGHPSFEASH